MSELEQLRKYLLDLASNVSTLIPSQVYNQVDEINILKIQAYVSNVNIDYMSGHILILSDTSKMDKYSLSLPLTDIDNIKVGDELILLGVTELDKVTGNIVIKGWVQP